MKKYLVAVSIVVACGVILQAVSHTDNFNRGNENPLASPWTNPVASADGNFSLGSNHVDPQGGSLFCLMYYSDTWSGDQESQVTIGGSNITSAAANGFAAVRIQSSAQTAYMYGIHNGASSYEIGKLSAGTYSTLQSCSGTPAVSDVIKLSITGSSLTGTVNGGSTCTKSDGTISGGAPGMAGYGTLGIIFLDDWSGADVGGGGGGSGVVKTCNAFGLICH